MRKRNPNDLNAAEAFRLPDAAKLKSVGANVLRDPSSAASSRPASSETRRVRRS